MLLNCVATSSNSQLLSPIIIAAIIGAIVSLPGHFLNKSNAKLQRQKSERDEIYKKLNSFYGPIRLQLKMSRSLYDLFSASVKDRLKINEFKTLPFILAGKEFSQTEKTLLDQILKIGKNIEGIIDNNAGLIDGDGVHDEMVRLGTHIRIIREAVNGGYEIGRNKLTILEEHTFPDIEERIDEIFDTLKERLDILNK